MGTSLTAIIVNDDLIRALGNTLIHSLWQGVLLAAAGAVIIVCTKKQRAAVRYNLLIAALLTFTLSVLITFAVQLQPAPRGNVVLMAGHANVTVVNADPMPGVISIDPNAGQSLGDKLMEFLNAHCNTIVLIWFLILCIKSIRLAVGGYEIYLLKRTKLSPVNEHWDQRVQQLAERLKVKQAVAFVESGLAKAPMVIGHLKPLILIPIGFINALPASEVEAILIHELAHIRRRDYLVNLLQSFMEVVFFFNPAVMWISQLIKAERENCCDDIAISEAGSKANYIQALLSCQEYQLAAPGLSMAMAKNKGDLLNRVKRIVNNNNQSLNVVEKTLLTVCLVTAGLLTVAFSAKDVAKKPAAIAKQQNEHRLDLTIARVANGENAKGVNGSTATVIANGTNDSLLSGSAVQITPTPQMVVQSNIKSVQADTAMSTKALIYNPADFGDGTTMHVSDSKSGKPVDSYLFKRAGVLYQVFVNEGKASTLYVNGKPAPVGAYKDKIKGLLKEFDQLAGAKPPVPVVAPVANTAMVSVAPVAANVGRPATAVSSIKGTPEIALKAPAAPGVAVIAAPAPPAVVATPPVPPAAPTGFVSSGTGGGPDFDSIVDMLAERGYIKDKNNIDFAITNKSLKINGVEQSATLHKELIGKFIKTPGDQISWSYSRHK